MKHRIVVRILPVAIGLAAIVMGGTDPIVPQASSEGAAPEEISPDRPGLTEPTDTLSPGTLELEGGLLLSRHAMESSREFAAPFSLLRIGVTRFAEARLGADGFARESTLVDGARQHHSGGSDLEAGLKVRVWSEQRYLPAFTAIGSLSIPTGSAYFSSGRRDPSLELCWSKSLPAHFQAGGNVNFRWGAETTEHAVSLSVSRKLGRGIGAYGEVYRLSPIEGDEPAHWIADTGITKLLGINTQVDIELGHTLCARTPYWFVGAGFAIRFSRPPVIRALSRNAHEPAPKG
ncbi:MAG: transporter [Acidobacteriia bacterium]|nr:transporter [Terriglobia bacterium]